MAPGPVKLIDLGQDRKSAAGALSALTRNG